MKSIILPNLSLPQADRIIDEGTQVSLLSDSNDSEFDVDFNILSPDLANTRAEAEAASSSYHDSPASKLKRLQTEEERSIDEEVVQIKNILIYNYFINILSMYYLSGIYHSIKCYTSTGQS